MYFWWLFHNYSCPFTSQKDEVISSPQVWIAYNMQTPCTSPKTFIFRNMLLTVLWWHLLKSTATTPGNYLNYWFVLYFMAKWCNSLSQPMHWFFQELSGDFVKTTTKIFILCNTDFHSICFASQITVRQNKDHPNKATMPLKCLTIYTRIKENLPKT